MKTPNIESLKLQRDQLREKAHFIHTEEVWRSYKFTRNALKAEIRSARNSFIENALSSRKSRDVWKVIHRVLKPNPKPLRVDVEDLNQYFLATAKRTTGSQTKSIEQLSDMIDEFSNDKDVRQVSTNEIEYIIKTLCTDS